MVRRFIILYFLVLVHAGSAQLEKSLVAKFTFNDGDLKDQQGDGSAKVYNASLSNDRFGNENSAILLHGNLGSYINIGSEDYLKPKRGSVSLWVKVDHLMPNGVGTDFNPIIVTRVNSDDSFYEAYFMGYDLKTKRIAVNTTQSKEKQVSVYSADQVRLNTWHHLVITYDNRFLIFYIDGIQEGKVAKNFETQFLANDSIVLGNFIDNKNKRFLNGSIDDIEIYSKVLTKEEVLDLYNAPNPNRNAIVLKWVLVSIGIVLLLLMSIWLIRRRVSYMVSKEKERNQLMNYALEQEIKMLKAQMDPHFMFNALNTILQFIVIKENEKAELYLTKFSKLIRKLLESNTQESVSLNDELDLLKKYIEIESMRFDEVFEPVVNISENIDPEKIFIPHMLIQPFVENAIWHGLRLKEGEKRMLISFEWINEKALSCIIDDNGVGRSSQTSELKRENRSLAIGFIRQRLELMSRIHNYTYSVEIIDKVNERGMNIGTRVEMTIPVLKRKEHDTSNFN